VSNYTFETITADQALAYNAQADSLTTDVFLFGVFPFWDDVAGTLRLTSSTTLRGVTFGSGIYGETIVAPGGVTAQIGTPGADFFTYHSVVYAGGGDDIIGQGASAAYGGTGSDIFVSTYGYHITEIRDWEAGDRLYMSATAPIAANYVEGSADDQNAAIAFSNSQFSQGKDYVVVAVGPNLYVFADYLDTGGTPASTTEIMGRGLADISVANFLGGPLPTDPSLPPLINGASGTVAGNMDVQHLNSLLGAPIDVASPNLLVLNGATVDLTVQGFGLTYDANEQITGGLVSNIRFDSATFHLSLSVRNVSAVSFGAWVAGDQTQLAFQTILAGYDGIAGSPGADLLRGYDGNDILAGAGGADSIFGGLGNDFIYAENGPINQGAPLGSGPSYLRGDEGDDHIYGGSAFDDINGNMGNDTISGGVGDDWTVGGKDNDLLSGDAGGDVVWGNLGNDTCSGGDGNDQVRGGQGDDSVSGGAGDDYVSGDRGNDTISGGSGADLFHGSQDAGIDRVLDFNQAEGDRVFLDPGTTYTLSQAGADTVIDMGGGHQMILVGIQMSTLTPGWIFGA
jgi:Ca2+-binding RTX toxin-like protein